MDQSTKLKYLWTYRPPFVVFLFCIASFALTLFSLSVFIAQTEKIANPDVLDWNRLLIKLTKLEYCLPQSFNGVQSKSHPANNSVTSLAVEISQSFLEPLYALANDSQLVVQARGSVLAKHMGRGIRPEFHEELIFVTINLPRQLDKNINSQVACLQVEGSKQFLKHLEANITTSVCDFNKIQGDYKLVNFLTHSSDHKPASWCKQEPDDLILNLDFLMDYNPKLTMYVTSQDKELIHLHLMVTSVFLFAVLAFVIIAFLIRSVNSNRKSMDSRGEHHIIMMTELNAEE